jgi:hypothetical protein
VRVRSPVTPKPKIIRGVPYTAAVLAAQIAGSVPINNAWPMSVELAASVSLTTHTFRPLDRVDRHSAGRKTNTDSVRLSALFRLCLGKPP